jgi:hypothetical protein
MGVVLARIGAGVSKVRVLFSFCILVVSIVGAAFLVDDASFEMIRVPFQLDDAGFAVVRVAFSSSQALLLMIERASRSSMQAAQWSM